MATKKKGTGKGGAKKGTDRVTELISCLDLIPGLVDARASELAGSLSDAARVNDWAYRLAVAAYARAGGASFAEEPDPFGGPQLMPMGPNRETYLRLNELTARLETEVGLLASDGGPGPVAGVRRTFLGVLELMAVLFGGAAPQAGPEREKGATRLFAIIRRKKDNYVVVPEEYDIVGYLEAASKEEAMARINPMNRMLGHDAIDDEDPTMGGDSWLDLVEKDQMYYLVEELHRRDGAWIASAAKERGRRR